MQCFRGLKTVHRRFATVHMRVALPLAGDLLPFTLSAGQKGCYAVLGHFYAFRVSRGVVWQLNPSSLVGDTTTRYRDDGNECFAFPLMNCSELHICYNLRIYMWWFEKINENFRPKSLDPGDLCGNCEDRGSWWREGAGVVYYSISA